MRGLTRTRAGFAKKAATMRSRTAWTESILSTSSATIRPDAIEKAQQKDFSEIDRLLHAASRSLQGPTWHGGLCRLAAELGQAFSRQLLVVM